MSGSVVQRALSHAFAALLAMASVAAAEVILDEDFEDRVVGTNVPGWGVNAPLVVVAALDEPGNWGRVRSDLPTIYEFVDELAGSVYIDLWMYPKQGSSTNNFLGVRATTGDYIRVGKNSNNQWTYAHATQSREEVFWHADNRGHRIRLRIDTRTGVYSIDFDRDSDGVFDTEIASLTTGVTEAVTHIFINSGRGGRGTSSYVDDILVTRIPPNEPPNTDEAEPSLSTIWPPNNKMVDISILGVTDPDGDDITITITGISDDETNDGDDHGAIGSGTAQVRAERDPKGTGRTYTIAFEASDGSDTAPGEVTVTVPHDQGQGKSKGRAKTLGVESSSWGEIKDSVK